MSKPCDVCGGRGRITLPLRRPAVAEFRGEPIPLRVERSSRDYSCPECADMVPLERVAVVSTMSAKFAEDIDYLAMLTRGSVRQIADAVHDRGYMHVEEGGASPDFQRTAIRVSLGVVARKHVARIEDRVAQGQDAICAEVKDEVARVLGRYPTATGYILDIQSVVNDAIDYVLAKRKAHETKA